MYYTNYFEGIDLSSLEASLKTLYYNAEVLISSNERARTSFNDSNWESKARIILDQAFDANDSYLNDLRNKISTFISSLSYAKQIQEIQFHMESGELDEHDLYGGASEIERQLYLFNEEISMLSIESESIDNFISSNITDDSFSASISKLNTSKGWFESYYDSLDSDYNTFNSLESSLSSDSYLNYAFGVVASIYDKLINKRNRMKEWINSYIDSLKSIEDSLPDNDTSVIFSMSNVESVSRTYASVPSLEEYGKAGQTSEIKPVSTSTTTSNTSTSTSTSDYSYSPTGGSSNNTTNDDTDVKKTDTSSNYGTPVINSVSDYEKYGLGQASNVSNYHTKTDTSIGPDNKTGLSDYDRERMRKNFEESVDSSIKKYNNTTLATSDTNPFLNSTNLNNSSNTSSVNKNTTNDNNSFIYYDPNKKQNYIYISGKKYYLGN